MSLKKYPWSHIVHISKLEPFSLKMSQFLQFSNSCLQAENTRIDVNMCMEHDNIINGSCLKPKFILHVDCTCLPNPNSNPLLKYILIQVIDHVLRFYFIEFICHSVVIRLDFCQPIPPF